MFPSSLRLALLTVVLTAGSAAAAPILWIVSGNFAGGGSASGSFVYDANTNLYSVINVTTTAGGGFPGASMGFISNGIPPTNFNVLLAAANPTVVGTPALFLSFGALLTNAGGTIGMTMTEGTCANPTCANPTTIVRNGEGTVRSSAVPEPASALLLGLGLAGLLATRRLKRRA